MASALDLNTVRAWLELKTTLAFVSQAASATSYTSSPAATKMLIIGWCQASIGRTRRRGVDMMVESPARSMRF